MDVHLRIAEAVATITIDRPEALNALDPTAQADLRQHLIAGRDDDAVRVIVLTGARPASFLRRRRS
jgi:enoyl-CoA hydratase/carnithine racemase